MSSFVIASQFPASVNQQLRQRLPQATILEVPRGVLHELDARASVLLATPMTIHGQQVPQTAPPGWPYGLKWIQLISSGIDAYPSWFLKGVPVATAKGSSAEAIAEFALAAIFAAAKQLPKIWISEATQFDWNRRPQLASIGGSTLGLYGFGAIGSVLARKALALGMQVVALRRSDAPFEVDGVQRAASLQDLFARADHLVVAAPLNAGTRLSIGRAELAAAKPGLHLINIARGALIDHAALLAALDDGRIALASLDVTEPEPLPAGHRLYTHARVRLTPHIASASADVMRRVGDIFIHNLNAFSGQAPLLNLVDHNDVQDVPDVHDVH